MGVAPDRNRSPQQSVHAPDSAASSLFFLFADEAEGKRGPALRKEALPALPEPFW